VPANRVDTSGWEGGGSVVVCVALNRYVLRAKKFQQLWYRDTEHLHKQSGRKERKQSEIYD
jgi:hypothetical protein